MAGGSLLFFYGWWNPANLKLLLFSILFNYGVGYALRKRLALKISIKLLLIIGSHYYPEIQEKVSKIIQGKPATFGIRVEKDNFAEYEKFYKMKIKEFLEKEGEGKRWRGGGA